jgi:D-alanyl-D-alanine endopeptidase (penicillin-binding protein 7)
MHKFFGFLSLFILLLSVAFNSYADNQLSNLNNKFSKYMSDPKVRSPIAMIVNQNNGEVIYQKNAYSVGSIASLTKLMSAMVILDSKIDLNKKIKISKQDIDRLKGTGSRIPIGTLISGYDLLKISLMSSDNRAASALSRAYPSGKKGFIKAMNIKALKLGMHNSKFADPTGLNKRNKSTARDLVRMVEAAYQYPLIRKITTTPQEAFKIGKRKNEIGYVNTNRLVRKGTWDIGLSKTGFTRDAGRCLVMQATINNEPVIMIFLNSYGTLTRFADAQRVKKWIKKESIMNKISLVVK